MNDEDKKFIIEYETETWSRCADSYLDTFSMLTGQMLARVIEAANVTSGNRVLDIGCGPGNSTRALADAGAIATGVDFSESMVVAAKAANPGLSFKLADGEKIPEDDDSFDAVIANYVVHHLPEPDKVFAEAARVLKPGGRFVFAVWGAPSEQSSIGCFVRAVSAHHDPQALPHGPLFGVTDEETFLPLMENAGLAGFELTNHKTEWVCDTLDPVIHGLWNWADVKAFPQEKQDKIMAEMKENCSEFAVDDGFVFPHTAILGHATKP